MSTLEQMMTTSMMRMMAACVRFSEMRIAGLDDDCDHPSPRMSIFHAAQSPALAAKCFPFFFCFFSELDRCVSNCSQRWRWEQLQSGPNGTIFRRPPPKKSQLVASSRSAWQDLALNVTPCLATGGQPVATAAAAVAAVAVSVDAPPWRAIHLPMTSDCLRVVRDPCFPFIQPVPTNKVQEWNKKTWINPSVWVDTKRRKMQHFPPIDPDDAKLIGRWSRMY